MKLRILYLLLLFIFISISSCSGDCPVVENENETENDGYPSENDMKYDLRKSYAYKLETEIWISLPNGSATNRDMESFRLDAIARIRKNDDDCEFLLSLAQINITDESGNVHEFNNHDGMLVFYYKNYRLREKLLHEKRNDSDMSANIKRAIVSLLQTSTNDISLEEADISGFCPTSYKSSENGITKTKDLNKCYGRFEDSFLMPGLASLGKSVGIPIVPTLDSKLKCTHKLDNGIVENVQCAERHIYVDIMNGNKPIVTTVDSSLRLIEVTTEELVNNALKVPSNSDFSLSWAYYDNSGNQTNEELVTTIKKLMSQMGETDINSGIKKSEKYLENISALRKLVGLIKNSDEIDEIVQEILKVKWIFPGLSNKDSRNEILRLVNDGSSFAIWDYVNKISKKGENYLTKNSLYKMIKTFPWMQNFGSKTFSVAANLITILQQTLSCQDPHCDESFSEDHTVSTKILSLILNKIHVCITEVDDCGKNKDFKMFRDVIQKFIENLPNLDRTEVGVEESSISDESKDLSTRCPGINLEKSNSYALYCVKNSFRQFPCNKNGKSVMQSILKNSSVASDIRIQAYAAMMNCYNEDDLNLVEQLFTDFNVNSDLLNFITTHIENRLQMLPSHFLSSMQPKINDFKQNGSTARKVSTNFVYSVEDGETKFHIDINNIFSNSSFLPSGIEGTISIAYNGQMKTLFEFGLFSDQLEAFIKKELTLSSASSISEGSVLVYLRQRGSTIFLKKWSLQQVAANSMHFLKNIKNSIEYIPQLLKSLLQDQTSNYFLWKPFLSEELTIRTTGGIPLRYKLDGNGFVSLKVHLEREISPEDEKDSFNFTGIFKPIASTSLFSVVSAGFSKYEISIKNEAKLHLAADLQWSAFETNGPNITFQFHSPKDKIISVQLSKSSLFTDFINYDFITYRVPPFVRRRGVGKIISSRNCYSAENLDLRFCSDYHSASGVFSHDISVFRIKGVVKSISLGFNINHEEFGKSMELFFDTRAINGTTSPIMSAYLDYTMKKDFIEATLKTNVLGYNTRMISFSGINKVHLKELNILLSGDNSRNNYSAQLYFKEIMNPENPSREMKYSWVYRGPQNGILCRFPLYLLCNIEYEILVQFSTPSFQKPLNILEISVTQDYKEQVQFKVATGGPFKIAEGVIQGKAWYKDNKDSQSEEADSLIYNAGVLFEANSTSFGSLTFNNSLVLNYSKDYEISETCNHTWNTIIEYGKGEITDKRKILYTVISASSTTPFENETTNGYIYKDIISQELKSTEYPFRHLNFNLDIEKVWDIFSDVPRMIVKFLPEYSGQPLELSWEIRKYNWDSFDEFTLDNSFSVKFVDFNLSLKTFLNKQRQSVESDLIWQLNFIDEHKISLYVNTSAEEQLLKGSIKISNNLEYQMEKNRSTEKTQDGRSIRTKYLFSIQEVSTNIKLLSYVLTMEPEVKHFVVKYKNEKYAEYELKGKMSDSKINNKIFVDKLLDGNTIIKFNEDGSIWPVEIQVDTEWIPKKWKIGGIITLSLSPIMENNLLLDTTLTWRPINAGKNNSLGKINGLAIINYEAYIWDSFYTIQRKDEDDSHLKIYGGLTDIHRNIYSPSVDISLKIPEEVFLLNYLPNAKNNSGSDVRWEWEANFKLHNETQLYLKVKEQNTKDENNYFTKYWTMSETMGIVIRKNALPLLATHIQSDIDVKLSGEQKLARAGKMHSESWNAKFNFSSEGGFLPKKEYTLIHDVDSYNSNDTADYDNIIDKINARYIDTKMTLLEDEIVKWEFTGTCKTKEEPIKYSNYSSIESYNSEKGEYDYKDVFYVDWNKYVLEFNYSLMTAVNFYNKSTSLNKQITGSSEFTGLFASWYNFEASQNHSILIPYFSYGPKKWNTIILHSSNETGSTINIGQSDAFRVKFFLNGEKVNSVCIIDIKDYQSSILLDLDRTISWKKVNANVQVKSTLPHLKIGKFIVNHDLDNYLSSFSSTLNQNEIRTHFKFEPENNTSEFIFNVANSLDYNSSYRFNIQFQSTFKSPEIDHITISQKRITFLETTYEKNGKKYFVAKTFALPSELKFRGVLYISNYTDWAIALVPVAYNGKPGIQGVLVYDIAKPELMSANYNYNTTSFNGKINLRSEELADSLFHKTDEDVACNLLNNSSTSSQNSYLNTTIIKVGNFTEVKKSSKNIMTISLVYKHMDDGQCHVTLCSQTKNITNNCKDFTWKCSEGMPFCEIRKNNY